MPSNREHFIMVDKDLMDDPLFRTAAEKLAERGVLDTCQARAATLYALMRLWCYADTYIRDDDTLPMSVFGVSELVGIENVLEILPEQWFQEVDQYTVKLPGYCEKNNVVSRRERKAAKAERERQRRNEKRGQHVSDTCQPRGGNVPPYTNTYTDKENVAKATQKKAPRDDRKRQMRLLEAELTPGLNLDAWRQWLEYRIEIRKALTTASLTQAAHDMAALGSHAEQLDAVKHTIGKGWIGLQPRNNQRSATTLARPTRLTQESALAALDEASPPERDTDQGFMRLEN